MSKSLIAAAALFTAGIGGAFAQTASTPTASTPTVWGAPYHGPSTFGTATDAVTPRAAEAMRTGDARLMSLAAGRAQARSHRR